MKFLVVVPTLNPGNVWLQWIKAIKGQVQLSKDVLVVDSGSGDSTVDLAVNSGFRVASIDKGSFNHGGTRQKVVDEHPGYDYVVFFTQDALLTGKKSLSNLLSYFKDPDVAAVYGRQLPRKSATPIEAHARIYNYSKLSYVRTINDKRRYGLKTAFISNSFSAYRVSSLNEVGGFPKDVIFGEDMYVAAKLLKSGYKIAYAADACVYHSHDYSILQEIKRYFDMGVFHAREFWIRRELGGAEGEGLKFVASEFKYLFRHAFWLIPEGMLRTLLRYTGFRLGLMEKRLPLSLKRALAMNKGYFKR